MDMTRINSARFRRSLSDLYEISRSQIIFQRFSKFKYLGILFKKSTLNKSGDNEDDQIVLRHMPEIGINYEATEIINIGDIENLTNVSDNEFKKACDDASIKCHKYAKFFLIAELFSKFCELFLVVIIPLYSVLKFTQDEILIFLILLIPILLIQVSCDWSKLLEKYSRLCYEFHMLSASKSETRLEEFNKLVFTFRSDFIYADMIV